MRLNDEQLKRYDRNILVDEVLEDGQKKLLKSRVLVCGAGGLGSTMIANLASLGVGHIGIVDDDCVELSNLNRQYIHKITSLGCDKVNSAKRWIEEYNKDIEVKAFKRRLDMENFRDITAEYDIIVDCFDSFSSKFLLNDIAIETGKALIHGGVTGFCGQVMTIIPKKSACLRCIFPDADVEEYTVKGVVSPMVSLVSSYESLEVLKLILDKEELLINKMLVLNGLSADAPRVLNIRQNKHCRCQAL